MTHFFAILHPRSSLFNLGVWLLSILYLVITLGISPVLADEGTTPTGESSGLFSAQIKRRTLTVSPRVHFTALDRRLYSSVDAMDGINVIHARTDYSSITEEMSYRLWYGYRLKPFQIGMGVLDRVEFKKLHQNSTTIGRERMGSLDAWMPIGGSMYVALRGSLGEYATVEPSGAGGVVREQTVLYECRIGAGSEWRGASVGFKQALTWLQGDDHYQDLDIGVAWSVPDCERRWILRARFAGASPVFGRGSRSMFADRFIGGYATLPGWRLHELSGDSFVSGNAGLRIPLVSREGGAIGLIGFSEASWLLSFHAVSVGDGSVFRGEMPSHYSWMTGPRWVFDIPGGMRWTVQGEWCRPLRRERPDVFYFTLGIS
jgi:hypothetical protein